MLPENRIKNKISTNPDKRSGRGASEVSEIEDSKIPLSPPFAKGEITIKINYYNIKQ
jgi:hypothetical protein